MALQILNKIVRVLFVVLIYLLTLTAHGAEERKIIVITRTDSPPTIDECE